MQQIPKLRIRMDGASEHWVQAERDARPLQLFLALSLSPEEKEAYLASESVNDGNFISGFAHALEHTRRYA